MTKRCRLWRPSSSFRGFIHNAGLENAKRVGPNANGGEIGGATRIEECYYPQPAGVVKRN